MDISVKYEELLWNGIPIKSMSHEEVLTAYKEFLYKQQTGIVENASLYSEVFEAELTCLKLEKQVILLSDKNNFAPLSRHKVYKIATLSNEIINGIFQTNHKHKFKILL
jgi:hypothetical protein